jgi:phosphoenolpyruvate phosphomutase
MTPSKVDVLRGLLAADRIARAVGAHNALTARLVELAGFDAVWVSSFELSTSFALMDASLVTMTQYLDAAEAMDAAVGVPVIADCDTGFGGPLNVAYMVRSYQRRGIAAVCIEDKVFPKMNSLAQASHELLSTEEFVAKIKVAVRSREPSRMIVIARTESLIAGQPMSHALQRARAYAEAGADAILVHSKSPSPDQVLEFAAAWDLEVPLVAVPTMHPQTSEDVLQEAGYRLVIYANHGLRSLIRGVLDTLRELNRGRCAAAVESRLCTVEDVFALVNGYPIGEQR